MSEVQLFLRVERKKALPRVRGNALLSALGRRRLAVVRLIVLSTANFPVPCEHGLLAVGLVLLRCESDLDVVDADPKTRRVLCRMNPNHWDWEESPQYYAVFGWMDEEWICANLLTTCP